MTWLYVLLPAGMIVSPALFLALWCFWTGVRRGFLRLAVATLVTLLAFAGSALLSWPDGTRSQAHLMIWSMGGFWLLLFGFGVPMVRNAVRALPAVTPAASLKTRRVHLFPGAFVWPFVVWAGLAAWLFSSSGFQWLHVVGPAVGLLSLVFLPYALRLAAQEPEPLGGADPDRLAAEYASFRERRVKVMYWMFVALALAVSSSWRVLPFQPGLVGAVFGCMGALFGTWADAQRYLLRRQLSGAEPPR